MNIKTKIHKSRTKKQNNAFQIKIHRSQTLKKLTQLYKNNKIMIKLRKKNNYKISKKFQKMKSQVLPIKTTFHRNRKQTNKCKVQLINRIVLYNYNNKAQL